jgi:uncharacterized membrane protein
MVATRNQGAIEHQTIIDDNLLPSADELQKLKEIDPSIVSWILEHADKEQKERIAFNTGKLKLVMAEHRIVISALWLAFGVLVIGMIMSSIFVFNNMEIAGTVFGGVFMIACVQAFLRFGRKRK